MTHIEGGKWTQDPNTTQDEDGLGQINTDINNGNQIFFVAIYHKTWQSDMKLLLITRG